MEGSKSTRCVITWFQTIHNLTNDFLPLQNWPNQVPPYKKLQHHPDDDKETASEKKLICEPVFVETKWDDYDSETGEFL